jgi:hypothetical protein
MCGEVAVACVEESVIPALRKVTKKNPSTITDSSEPKIDIRTSLTLKVKKVKQSLYTPWRRLGGEEV